MVKTSWLVVALAVGLGCVAANADVPTTLTHYEDTDAGLTVVSDVSYDGINGWNIFNYNVTNQSGDTLFQAVFTGQDWVGGGGINQTWSVDIASSTPADPLVDYIRFYGSFLHSNMNEEFIAGSSWIDSWAIGTAEFKSEQANTFTVQVLKPSYIPEPVTGLIVALGAAGLISRRRR